MFTSSLARSQNFLYTQMLVRNRSCINKSFNPTCWTHDSSISSKVEKWSKLRTRVVTALRKLPEVVEESLNLKTIAEIAPEIAEKDNALFLGRGIFIQLQKKAHLN